MTCESMLDRLLDADLVELEGDGESSLAVHLRHCPRCRAAAGRILSVTSALAADVTGLSRGVPVRQAVASSMRARSTRSRSTRTRIAAGLAAATLIVVGVRGWVSRAGMPDDPHRPQGAAVVDIEAAAVPMTPDSGRDPVQPTREVRASIASRTSRRHTRGMDRSALQSPRVMAASAEAVAATPVVAATVKPPPSVAPVRIESTPIEPLGSHVMADPPAGTRAEIRRTADPAVTVVWLYR